MTTQTNEKLELTPEQDHKLGQVYQMILSWRNLQRDSKQCESEKISENIHLGNQGELLESEA